MATVLTTFLATTAAITLTLIQAPHNQLVNIKCHEPVDIIVLNKLLNSDLLRTKFRCELIHGSEDKQLLKYKDKIVDGFAEIVYLRK